MLNAKGATPHINGFLWILTDSSMRFPVLGWTCHQEARGPTVYIRFANDGTKLLVAVSGTNQILVFQVADNGIAAKPAAQVSAGAQPFGIRFGRNGIAILSEALDLRHPTILMRQICWM